VDHALETGLRHRLRRALRRMESQHLHLRSLLGELDTALRDGAHAELPERLTRLRLALAAHFEVEDSVLFPALHGLSPHSQQDLEALSNEHGAFLDELLALASALDTARSAESFSRLRASLAEHERREERLLDGFVTPGNSHDV